jgi:serine/threonine-protein kinase HipA
MVAGAVPDERYVYVNGDRVGVLAADAAGRLAFTYEPDTSPDAFASLLMPVRRASYFWPALHPVFAACLPDGPTRAALDAALTQRGRSGPFDAVDATLPGPGRLAIGRPGAPPEPRQPPAPDTIMTAADSRDAFARLYAARFRLAVPLPEGTRLVEAFDEEAIYRADTGDGAEVYNEAAALAIARRAGFDAPAATISADGRILRLARYDGLTGARHALEDLGALQALSPEARYSGSAERLTSVAAALAPAVNRTAVRRELFRRLLLAHLLLDCDRHLRTYAVLADTVDEFRLAPLVGLRTAWERSFDNPALVPAASVGGARRFDLPRGTLRRLGAHCALSDRETKAIVGWLDSAVAAASAELAAGADERTRPWLERLAAYWARGARLLHAAY